MLILLDDIRADPLCVPKWAGCKIHWNSFLARKHLDHLGYGCCGLSMPVGNSPINCLPEVLDYNKWRGFGHISVDQKASDLPYIFFVSKGGPCSVITTFQTVSEQFYHFLVSCVSLWFWQCEILVHPLKTGNLLIMSPQSLAVLNVTTRFGCCKMTETIRNVGRLFLHGCISCSLFTK